MSGAGGRVAFASFISTLSAGILARFARFASHREQLAGAVLVAILHALAIWSISLHVAREASPPSLGEIHVAIQRELPQAKPEEPPQVELDPVMLQPPEIVIQNESDAVPGSVSPADVLAPRPDPSHPNEPPSGKIIHGDASRLSPVFLSLLVGDDGTVAEAKVVKSCGDGSIDENVIAYVKANWRYLPALVREKTAIQYWMTVSVRFGV